MNNFLYLYFFYLINKKKNFFFFNFLKKNFFIPSNLFLNNLKSIFYLKKLSICFNKNSFYSLNSLNSFYFLLILLEFFFFKKKLKKLILKYIILEYKFFNQLYIQKKFFFNENNIFFFLDKYKIIKFFFYFSKTFKKEPKILIENKESAPISIKNKKFKKKPFRSYLLDLQFPAQLKQDYFFNVSFKKFLYEYKLIRREYEKKLKIKNQKLKKLAHQKKLKTENKIQSSKKNQPLNKITTRKMSTFSFKKKPPIKKYNSQIYYFFSKLVTLNTKDGLKKKSLRIFLKCLSIAKSELKLKSLNNKDILTKIFFNLEPFFLLKKFNLGRKVLIIPLPMTKNKRIKTISQLFLAGIRNRSEFSFRRRLIEEIKDFYIKNKIPMSIKLRNERIKIAIENKNNIRFLRFFK